MDGATLSSSVISLVKTILGAGLLSMPLAFSTDGIIGGIFIILLAGLTSGYGLWLQGYVSKYVPSGHATFFSICSITYPSLSVIFDVAIAIQCFGVCLSYIVLIGDLMPSVLSTGYFEDDRMFWILASAVVIVPLCYLRNLDSLKYTSILALTAILYMSLLVIFHFLAGDVNPDLRGPTHLFPKSTTDVFSTFSIIVFAFTGHQNMFSIVNEISDKSLKNLTFLVNFSILLSSAFFVVVGLAGYLTFGDNVGGNVIGMYESSVSTTLARFSIVFMVLLSFPLMFHPCRISINNIYFWVSSTIFGSSTEEATTDIQPLLSNEINESPKAAIVPFPSRTFNVLTAILLVCAYVLSVSITSFALVLALVGATGSTAISFILPGLFGYKLIGSEALTTVSKKDLTLKYLSLALAIWGILVMILCLYASLFLDN